MESPKEEKCLCRCHNGIETHKQGEIDCLCNKVSSPTWEEKEREAWQKYLEDYPNKKQNYIKNLIDFSISRIKAVREETRKNHFCCKNQTIDPNDFCDYCLKAKE